MSQPLDISYLPFANLLGIELVEASPDRVVAKLEVRKELCTVPDILHGCAIMSFADTAGAVAFIRELTASPEKLAAVSERVKHYARRVVGLAGAVAAWQSLIGRSPLHEEFSSID